MKRFYPILLTGFGAGWLPLAPGTWGSVLALGIAWPLSMLPGPYLQLTLCLLIIAGAWIGAKGSEILAGEWGDDPSQTVLDEMVGMWIAILGLPMHWPLWLAAFFLFRIFDIFKPFGIRRLERLGMGWGVMADDMLAGVYTNVLLQIGWLLW